MEASIGGRTAATAATINHVVAQLWNPHATQRMSVTAIKYVVTTAGVANYGLLRSTARGTAGSSLTSVIDSDLGRGAAPVSGAILDLAAFTVQPTLANATIYLDRWNTPGVIGAGAIFTFADPIEIPPGTGLCIVTPPAVVFPASDVAFNWRE